MLKDLRNPSWQISKRYSDQWKNNYHAQKNEWKLKKDSLIKVILIKESITKIKKKEHQNIS